MSALEALPLLALVAVALPAEERLEFKQRCLDDLIAQTPGLLASQNVKTGRFGEGIWIVNDQHAMLPLAVVWSTRADSNPYFHGKRLMGAIVAAGDALIDDQDETGKWVFRKKDGSTWGRIFMPWTYSRWIRTFALIRDAMPAAARARWEKALRLGYSGIRKDLENGRIHNIPSHHAKGLYFASKALSEPEWGTFAAGFLRKVAASQKPDGYWSEHQGPVVAYGFVYVDSLGVYYSASGDEAVLPVLRKAAVFHSYFTYPDGSDVETVDERNPYHSGVRIPNAGFTVTAEGRGYAARQLRLRKDRLPPDEAALLLLHGQEGPASGIDTRSDFDYRLASGDAAVRRRGPWYLVASAFTAPVPSSRWIQDRQNFLSVHHDRAGLILGGGNTKLQPRWSTFTFGDLSAFFHKPGDENPDFRPPDGLFHVPTGARVVPGEGFSVELDYGSRHGSLRTKVLDPSRIECTWSGGGGLSGHATLLPRPGERFRTGADRSFQAGDEPFRLPPGDAEGVFDGERFQVSYPRGTAIEWPVLPHDPYKKDGSTETNQGRLVLDLAPGGPRTIVIRVKP
ncbi:MAG: hypothetical protein ACKV22_05780 [Bryobacteraceae bacterium]